MENDLERFILAAIASSFVVDDVVGLGNWRNRLKTRAVTFRSDFYGERNGQVKWRPPDLMRS